MTNDSFFRNRHFRNRGFGKYITRYLSLFHIHLLNKCLYFIQYFVQISYQIERQIDKESFHASNFSNILRLNILFCCKSGVKIQLFVANQGQRHDFFVANQGQETAMYQTDARQMYDCTHKWTNLHRRNK